MFFQILTYKTPKTDFLDKILIFGTECPVRFFLMILRGLMWPQIVKLQAATKLVIVISLHAACQTINPCSVHTFDTKMVLQKCYAIFWVQFWAFLGPILSPFWDSSEIFFVQFESNLSFFLRSITFFLSQFSLIWVQFGNLKVGF